MPTIFLYTCSEFYIWSSLHRKATYAKWLFFLWISPKIENFPVFWKSSFSSDDLSGVPNSVTTGLGGQINEWSWSGSSSSKLESVQPAASHLQPIVAQRKCGPSFARSSDFFPREEGIMKICFGEIFKCLNVIHQFTNL